MGHLKARFESSGSRGLNVWLAASATAAAAMGDFKSISLKHFRVNIDFFEMRLFERIGKKWMKNKNRGFTEIGNERNVRKLLIRRKLWLKSNFVTRRRQSFRPRLNQQEKLVWDLPALDTQTLFLVTKLCLFLPQDMFYFSPFSSVWADNVRWKYSS